MEFAIAEVMPGKLNALVKNMMRQMNVSDPNEAVRRVNSGEWIVTEKNKVRIIELIGTISIPARTEKFIACDHFVVDTTNEAKVKISYLGENFKEKFINKIEEPIAETKMRFGKLLKPSLDECIIKELGGEGKSESTLSGMFTLMELQPNREKGKLLINGNSNIFYIRDANDVLSTVICYWRDNGWHVRALHVAGPDRWFDGVQVFACNPSESEN